jgi:hypothetical protein
LSDRDNALEEALKRTGTPWAWVAEACLADPAAHDLSPTVDAVCQAVRQVASS